MYLEGGIGCQIDEYALGKMLVLKNHALFGLDIHWFNVNGVRCPFTLDKFRIVYHRFCD